MFKCSAENGQKNFRPGVIPGRKPVYWVSDNNRVSPAFLFKTFSRLSASAP